MFTKRQSLAVWTLNHSSLYFFQLNTSWKRFANQCILFLIKFHTTSKLLWKRGRRNNRIIWMIFQWNGTWRIAPSASQPHASKWTIRVYCGWCWREHASSSGLCSGRACSLRPLCADRSQKKAAERRGLVAPKRVGRGQFSGPKHLPFQCLYLRKSGSCFTSVGRSHNACHPFTPWHKFRPNHTNLICAADTL